MQINHSEAENHIRIEYDEPSIMVSINGELIARVVDSRFNRGHIVPFAWGQQGETVVGFDYFLLVEK